MISQFISILLFLPRGLFKVLQRKCFQYPLDSWDGLNKRRVCCILVLDGNFFAQVSLLYKIIINSEIDAALVSEPLTMTKEPMAIACKNETKKLTLAVEYKTLKNLEKQRLEEEFCHVYYKVKTKNFLLTDVCLQLPVIIS